LLAFKQKRKINKLQINSNIKI